MNQTKKSKDLSSSFSDIADSQLEQFRKKNTVRIAIIGDKAYWVLDNIFYETDVVDGEIDKESSRPIDTSQLSIKEVRMLMDVLDSIS